MPHPYSIVHDEDGGRTLTILAGSTIVVADGDHPNFDDLIAAAREAASPSDVLELADLSMAVAKKFDHLSERVSVGSGRLFFDGDEVDDSIARHILRCLDDPTVGDWRPLVAFLENVAANPTAHSREQLYDWLRVRDGITVTADGRLVAYKGVEATEDGAYLSLNRGTATVNGEQQSGRIAQRDGDVVEMPRSAVAHDPANACSTGLHVGTYGYAENWARGALLRVLVDPRDVVSVPTDAGGEKVRVSRYRILGIIDAPDTRPVAYDLTDDDEWGDL